MGTTQSPLPVRMENLDEVGPNLIRLSTKSTVSIKLSEVRATAVHRVEVKLLLLGSWGGESVALQKNHLR